MKLINRFFFVGLLWLAARTAGAQCVTPNSPACTFAAIDVATGLPVEAFCVGRGVRFEQCAGRNVPPTLLFYGVLAGAGTTFQPSCNPPHPLPYVYTPTPAEVGLVTVSELSNVTGNGTYYIRTFRVYDNPPPAFTVAPCPSGFALITVTDTAPYDSYTVQIGTGAAQPIGRNQATVVPVPAGATSVTVAGHYLANSGCAGTTTQALAPLAPAQVPVLSRLALQAPLPGGAATFDVAQLPAGYFYSLQLADGSAAGGFREVASVPAGSSSVALAAPAAGCYRLFRTDPCRLGSAASPLICTLSLAGRSGQNRNQLLLTDAGAGNTYAVTRDGRPLTGFTPIAGGLEDPNVQCGTTYTYVVMATQAGGGTAVSNPVSILTQSALPPAAPRLVASFNARDVVELTPFLTAGAPLPPGSTLQFSRAAGRLAPVALGTASRLTVQRDSTALAELKARPPCYTVRLVDVCGNASPASPPTCPALLSASAADADGQTVTLTWTPFTGPDPTIPTTYTLQRLTADGAVLNTLAVSGTSYTDLTPPPDRQVLRYRLRAGGAGLPAGTGSYSNQASVARRLFLTIPTAFTPNGDGLNDVLEVKGRYLKDFLFVVVDRNGQEVFRGTQRTDGWDGTINGHAPVLGTYAWRFQQAGEDGKPFTASGAVTILK
ncbi:MAG: hypothetical protein NVSMB30_24570 [Hymenobacter sp.]